MSLKNTQCNYFKIANLLYLNLKKFLSSWSSKSQAVPSIKLTSTPEKDTELSEITKEIRTYAEEDFYQVKTEEIIELYNDFKQAILNLSPMTKCKFGRFSNPPSAIRGTRNLSYRRELCKRLLTRSRTL